MSSNSSNFRSLSSKTLAKIAVNPSTASPKHQGSVPGTSNPFSILKDGSVAVSCHVKPGAKRSAVLAVTEAVECSLAAPPRDGEANDELLSLLAVTLATKKHTLSLISGPKSRSKVVRVDGMSVVEVEKLIITAIE
ncbi:hypothetical protein HDU93_003590 [Gonapodya sp. JEL0774]|nr:hypothetical protein HDU93_003590 [Gonapodya sp. JEL0774]